jgi:LacI family transcriptional regulator
MNRFGSSSADGEDGAAKRRGAVRLSDVAAAAGVSKTTASYVFNDRDGVSQATRDRVLAIAADLGYRPNSAARGVARGTVSQIGAVLSATSAQDDVPNYYVSELLAGVEAESRTRDYGLQVAMWTGEMPAMVSDGSVAGVLFLGGSFPIDALLEQTLPAVLVGTSFQEWPHDSVLADNRRGAYLAVQHLVADGRRRIAFINGPETTRTSEAKFLGYRDALRQAGIDMAPELVAEEPFDLARGHARALELLDRNPDIDAFFVADDPVAIGVLHALQERGISVPGQVAVLGYGDSPMGVVVQPRLSTVRVFQRWLGTLGARRLLNRLTGEEHSAVQMCISPELVLRGSTR